MNRNIITLIIMLICLLILIPFSSSDPDGLERVAEDLGIDKGNSPTINPMADYKLPMIENSYISTLTGGIIGFFLVLGLSYIFGRIMKKVDK